MTEPRLDLADWRSGRCEDRRERMPEIVPPKKTQARAARRTPLDAMKHIEVEVTIDEKSAT